VSRRFSWDKGKGRNGEARVNPLKRHKAFKMKFAAEDVTSKLHEAFKMKFAAKGCLCNDVKINKTTRSKQSTNGTATYVLE